MIQVKKVTATYSLKKKVYTVFSNLDLYVPRRGSVSIIGPSGCGKTTLLHIICGLKRPSMGEVLIDGEPVSRPRPKTALILQHFGLLPWKSVQDNASLGLRIRGFSKKASHSAIMPLLERLQIAHIRHHYPHQISGGQKQRVAIARALAIDPDIMVLDEPFSSLDAMTREAMQNLLLRIWKEQDLTLVLVTHSVEEAVFLGERILIMDHLNKGPMPGMENPRAGAAHIREEESYFQMCQVLRKELKNIKGSTDIHEKSTD